MRNLEFEALAERKEDFPHEELQEHKSFLEDALDMTRTHVPVKPIQIRHLKETLFKILEAMGIRVLQKNGAEVRADYFNILQEIESLIVGMEIDFGQKIASRFTDMLPEYIADHWNFNIIKHNRKLVSLLIDCMDDPTLLNDLYHILNNLVSAEAIQIQRKQELSAKITLKDAEHFEYVKNEEHAQQIQIESFKTLGIPEKARELIKLSVYGLCDYICKISIEELSKYPIGIIKSAEKMLKDLGQHKLKESEEQSLQDIPEYIEAVSIIDQALSGYNSNEEKYNFADIYKETDFTVDGISYCAFNDIILREIQNIMEADLVVDPSSDGNLSNNRMTELHVTIAERYRTEWIRQNDMRQQSEQEAMQELAAELL